jgi:cell division protein FtsL
MRFKLPRLSILPIKFKSLKILKRLKNLRNLKSFKNLKSLKNLRNLKNLKNLTILLLLNLMIVFAIYHVSNHQFKAINSPALAQKINQEKAAIDDLKHQLDNLSKRNETADKFDLSKQARLLRIITSAFDHLKTNAFESNHKGLVYAISGDSTTIALLAYKINKAISSSLIKAQIKSVLINNGGAVLKVQVFGVNVDD